MKTLTALATALALPLCLIAADEKPAAPATEAASGDFAPTALEQLKALKGKPVAVVGKITKLGENKTGTIRYLNYTENFQQSVSLVFFAKDGGGTFTKEKLGEYVGKAVRANGVLSEYNGNLQIKIESLDQLKVQPDPEPATAQ